MIEDQFFTLQRINQLPAQLFQLKQLIPEKNDSDEQWRQWANRLESDWLEALDLDKEAVTCLQAEAEAFRDYLYANELLIRCKHSSVGYLAEPGKSWKQGCEHWAMLVAPDPQKAHEFS